MADVSQLTMLTIKIEIFYVKSSNTGTYFVYFKSQRELSYDRFVNPNLLIYLFKHIYTG